MPWTYSARVRTARTSAISARPPAQARGIIAALAWPPATSAYPKLAYRSRTGQDGVRAAGAGARLVHGAGRARDLAPWARLARRALEPTPRARLARRALEPAL